MPSITRNSRRELQVLTEGGNFPALNPDVGPGNDVAAIKDANLPDYEIMRAGLSGGARDRNAGEERKDKSGGSDQTQSGNRTKHAHRTIYACPEQRFGNTGGFLPRSTAKWRSESSTHPYWRPNSPLSEPDSLNNQATFRSEPAIPTVRQSLIYAISPELAISAHCRSRSSWPNMR